MTGVQIAVAPLDSFMHSDLVRFPGRSSLLIVLFKLINFIATITGVLLRFSRSKINIAKSINFRSIDLNRVFRALAGLFQSI